MATAGAAVGGLAMPQRKLRVALIFTEFTYRSHAHVIAENFLKPYIFCGRRIEPPTQIVSMWGDQFPPGDMSAAVSQQFGIPIFPSIRQALTLGGSDLEVDAVLSIGEHGTYGLDPLGQKLYPRKRFFDEITDVMASTGRVVPLFSDKHLSYRWDWAKEMAATARELNMPFMAGSSVPLAQRRPALVLPHNADFKELLLVHCGGWGDNADAYDFHGLDTLQSLMESRRGAETGVSAIQRLEGDALWKAAVDGLWNPALAEAALRPELGDRASQWRELFPQKNLILVHYRDGLIAPMLAVGGNRWSFACRLKEDAAPRGCEFHVGPWLNRCLFKALSHAIQQFFVTGRPPYPIERTLLTTGMTHAVMKSRAEHGALQQTPHLQFHYRPRDFAAYRENGDSWQVLTDDVPEPKGIDPLGGVTLRR